MEAQQKPTKQTNFLFSESMFADSYIEYDTKRKCKSKLPKTGRTIFKWEGVQFHHISVGDNKVDFLIYREIIICSFPPKKDRNEIYTFIERHWEERIFPFTKYIDARRDSE